MKKIILETHQKNRIIELYMRGISRKSMSKELNITEHVIRIFLENADLPEQPYKYVGKRFGRLIVLSKSGKNKNGCPIVECLCDCGKITHVIVSNLTSSSSLTVSCGCYNKDKNLSKNPWLTEYNSYTTNVIKRRKFSFELTPQEFESLCSSLCFYCGVPPLQKMDVGRGFKNGIDRVDNTVGYKLDNCVCCCWNCNRMKGTMSHQDFLLHIRKIYNYSLV